MQKQTGNVESKFCRNDGALLPSCKSPPDPLQSPDDNSTLSILVRIKAVFVIHHERPNQLAILKDKGEGILKR
jgi:hypothetical protein